VGNTKREYKSKRRRGKTAGRGEGGGKRAAKRVECCGMVGEKSKCGEEGGGFI